MNPPTHHLHVHNPIYDQERQHEMTETEMTSNYLPGGPSAKTFHRAGSTTPNHQVDSKETRHV